MAPSTLWVLFVTILYALYGRCPAQEDNTKESNTVYIVLMLPYPDPENRTSFKADYDDGHDIAPVAYLAAEQINNRSDLLSGYELKLIRIDGGCNVLERTVIGLAEIVNSTHNHNTLIIGIAGPGCASSTRITAQLTTSSRLALTSVNYGTLLEFGSYPNIFGIIGSTSLWIDAYIALIMKNNWRNLAILYNEESVDLFEWAIELQRRLKGLSGYNISVASPVYKNFFPLQQIKDSFASVTFALLSPENSLRLLCFAFHEDMLFPNYQWIFSDRLDDDFIISNYDNLSLDCSQEDINFALTGQLNYFTNFYPENLTETTDTGLNYSQYEIKYKEEAEEYAKNYNVLASPTSWANPVYDAVWALALSFNNSLDELNESGFLPLSKPIPDHVSGNITELIQSNMKTVNFQGISGEIEFNDKTGFTSRTLNLLQYNGNGNSMQVGMYKEGKLSSNDYKFVSGDFQMIFQQIPSYLAALSILVSFIALFLIIPAHITNVLFRNHRAIKATSHQLNNFIFLGCYMLILGIAITTVSELLVSNLTSLPIVILCNAIPWCLGVGLILILGTVCMKTWRLYHILNKNVPATKHKVVKDRFIVIILVIVVLVDIFICLLWTTIDPLKPARESTINRQQGINVVIVSTECQSKWTPYWVLAHVCYKLMFMAASLFCALLTRKTDIKGFNTDNVVILVYLFTVISGLGIPSYIITSFFIDVGPTVPFVILCIVLNSVVFVCIFTLFVPPIISLFKERNVR